MLRRSQLNLSKESGSELCSVSQSKKNLCTCRGVDLVSRLKPKMVSIACILDAHVKPEVYNSAI